MYIQQCLSISLTKTYYLTSDLDYLTNDELNMVEIKLDLEGYFRRQGYDEYEVELDQLSAYLGNMSVCKNDVELYFPIYNEKGEVVVLSDILNDAIDELHEKANESSEWKC